MNGTDLKNNLTDRNTWLRGLLMLLFVVIYKVAEVVLLAVVLFQLGSKLFTGEVNARVLAFGDSLSVFVLQIWRFLTFNTETPPFPFAAWPDAHTCRHTPG